MSETQSPKEIFIHYGGSHFHMERDGIYQTYKSYNISRDQEIEWLSEYQDCLARKISESPTDSDSFSKLCQVVTLEGNIESLNKLINLTRNNAELLDSFSKVRYAEELIRTVKEFSRHRKHELYSEIINISKWLLQYVLTNPVTVAPHYRKISYLRGVLPDGKITSRAMANLKEIKELKF